MAWLGYVFVLFASGLNAVQTGCNSRLQKGTGQALLSAAVVYAVGLTGIGVALAVGRLVKGPGWVTAAAVGRVPWWGLVGGLLGATYILAMVTQAGRVGAGTFMALSLVATITMSVLIDNYGWLGMDRYPAGLWRIVGCVVMVGGVELVAMF